MSRIASPFEKIMGVAGIFRALTDELMVTQSDPIVQASLIDAAVAIAMATDTRDMGLFDRRAPMDTASGDHFLHPNPARCDDCGEVGGTHRPDVEH